MKKFIPLLFLFPQIFTAQENKDVFLGYSSVYAISVGKINGDIKNYISGQQITIGKDLTNSNQEWVKYLSAKNINFNLVHLDMNQMQKDLWGRNYAFGDAYAATANIDFRLAKLGNVDLLFSPTVGLSYITKTVYTDPDSYFFGSHLNAVFDAGLGMEYQFLRDFALTSKVSFLHFSNGGIQLPNAGVNTLAATVGIKKNIIASKKKEETNDEIIKSEMKKHGFEFSIGAGQRGKYKIKEAFYRVTFSSAYSYFINNMIGFKAGLDAVYYDQVFNPLVYDDSVPYWGKSYEHIRVGASLGTEIKMNKLSFNANYGTYVYFKSPYNQNTYWKAGLRYYITPKMGIESMMYAHKVQADIISFGAFVRL